MSHESHADSMPCQPAVSRALLPHQGHLRGHGNSSKPAAPADGMWSIECSSHAAGAQYNITAYRGHNGDEVVMWSWGKNTEKDGETFAGGTSVLWNLVKPRNIEMLNSELRTAFSLIPYVSTVMSCLWHWCAEVWTRPCMAWLNPMAPSDFCLTHQAKLLEAVASGEKLAALLEAPEARSDKVAALGLPASARLPQDPHGTLGEHRKSGISEVSQSHGKFLVVGKMIHRCPILRQRHFDAFFCPGSDDGSGAERRTTAALCPGQLEGLRWACHAKLQAATTDSSWKAGCHRLMRTLSLRQWDRIGWLCALQRNLWGERARGVSQIDSGTW